jgi:hypothetical protein
VATDFSDNSSNIDLPRRGIKRRPVPEAKGQIAEAEGRLALPFGYVTPLPAFRTAQETLARLIHPLADCLGNCVSKCITKRFDALPARRTIEPFTDGTECPLVKSSADPWLDTASDQFPKRTFVLL